MTRPCWHSAPREVRESIGEHGLDPDRAPAGCCPGGGVYLWGELDGALAYARTAGEDLWQVETEGLDLRPGGPATLDVRELWVAEAIPAERVRRLHYEGGE